MHVCVVMVSTFRTKRPKTVAVTISDIFLSLNQNLRYMPGHMQVTKKFIMGQSDSKAIMISQHVGILIDIFLGICSFHSQ